MNDICMAIMMGLDIQKISLLRTVYAELQKKKVKITLDGKNITLSDLQKYSILTTPPPGWADYLDASKQSSNLSA
jgi:hypothetical protein